MALFISALIGALVLGGVAVSLLGAVFGEAGLVLGAGLLAAALLALLVCVLSRLSDIEQKLDELLAAPVENKPRPKEPPAQD